MRLVGSNRFYLSPNEKRTLVSMAKDGSIIEDIEEGEISDEAQSVEEISAEDFKQEAKVAKPKGDSRVWMGDLLNYRVSSNYGPGLYNLAWAQAVQNKPLDEILGRDFRSNENSKRSSSNLLVNSREDNDNNKSTSVSKEVCNIIIDDDSSEEVDSKVEGAGQVEKEEGELEEGEIEVDSEMVGEEKEGVCGDGLPLGNSERNLKDEEFEKHIQSVREALQTVTVKDATKSFNGVCLQLCASLDSIHQMVSENCRSDIDALIQRAFTGVLVVNTVFLSMNTKQQEQNKEVFSRLLSHVKSKNPVLFLPQQLQEIEAAILSLDAKFSLSSVKGLEKEKEAQVNNKMNPNEFNILGERPFNSSNKYISEPASVKMVDQNNANRGSDASKQGIFSGFRSRGAFGPLLDLHRDHDADSLPSPTRETPPAFPLPKQQVTGDGVVEPEVATTKVADNIENAIVHPYETDALKAVSTYQQKFGRTSFFMKSELPSPTPSEECDVGDGDCNGEVSSSSTAGNSSIVNLPVPSQILASSTSHTTGASVPTKTVVQFGSGLNSNVKAPAKSRDPRLRVASSEAGAFDLNQHPPVAGALKSETFGGNNGSRKNKIVDKSMLDGHALKRQKNGLTSSVVSRDAQMVSGSGGWIEDGNTVRSLAIDKRQLEQHLGTDIRKSENGEYASGWRKDTAGANLNVANGGNEQSLLIGSSSTVSLPSLLKDIVVNPIVLMQLIMEQQKLAEAQKMSTSLVQNTTSAFSSSVIPGTVPPANVLSSNSSEIEQKLMVKPKAHTQVTSTNGQVERVKIRMKPRDPRRILHSGGILQKNENLGPEHFKVNDAPSSITQLGKDTLFVRQQGEQAQTTCLPSQSTPPPDIARQFTKKLKNLADILTSSEATNTASTIALAGSSQPMPAKMEKLNIGVVTDIKEQQSGSSKSEEGRAGISGSQNTWGDVEHLFEGFDDQQKAAIQKERARRIEEQNKMFAARKLCLVLDLDHTLLNSAKFVEVDPVHEEVLRKKEEQDREKSQRHLFRFQHMGMWTKLRPGIWNFLEKASKLFELHLYTMGNKLYATEMAKVLDPTGVLFAGRVISKGDDTDSLDGDERVPKSKDLDGVLGMESAVVIIDDSVRVWPHNKLNLIVVERYTYFPCSRRQFGLLGPSLLEIDHDERPEDGTLASSLGVIERLHQIFFSHWSLHDVDVRNILASEQRKILAGCRIVFSRVFPLGEANPHLHPLWQTAEQFGAVCTTQIDDQATHVVANSRGTDKVNWALSTRRFVVQPGWVEASALLYRRANEHDFAV